MVVTTARAMDVAVVVGLDRGFQFLARRFAVGDFGRGW